MPLVSIDAVFDGYGVNRLWWSAGRPRGLIWHSSRRAAGAPFRHETETPRLSTTEETPEQHPLARDHEGTQSAERQAMIDTARTYHFVIDTLAPTACQWPGSRSTSRTWLGS